MGEFICFLLVIMTDHVMVIIGFSVIFEGSTVLSVGIFDGEFV